VDYEKLGECDISTAVLNDRLSLAWPQLQKGAKAKYSTAAFPKLFMFRERTQVSLVTMSHPSQRTVAPPPCLPLDIKDSLRRMRVFLMAGFFDGGLMGGFFNGDC
jgi:hypothetical protein